MALGWCFKRVGQLDEAIGALEHAIAVDPSEAVLHYNLACYWSLARNRRRALAVPGPRAWRSTGTSASSSATNLTSIRFGWIRCSRR